MERATGHGKRERQGEGIGLNNHNLFKPVYQSVVLATSLSF